MLTYVYVALVALAMLATRITLLACRSSYYRTEDDMHGARLGLVTMVTTFALIAYGFVSLEWYWPLVAFGVGIVLQTTITRSNFATFYAIRIPLELAAIGGAIALWSGLLK
jgi:hypothetical protein